MEFGQQHDTTDTMDFCTRQLVMDLLRTCHEETGVMNFGLYATVCRPSVCLYFRPSACDVQVHRLEYFENNITAE